MSARLPIEALLRPPVELYSAVPMGLASILLAVAPGRLGMVPSIGYAIAAGFALISCIRLAQGIRIIKYHAGLKRLPLWQITAEQIPVSNKYLFHGKGFRWTSVHSQRLYDAQKPANARFVQPGRFTRLARRLDLVAEQSSSSILRAVNAVAQADVWLSVGPWVFRNPVAPLPPVGGFSAIHGVGLAEGEENIFQDLAERVGHMAVFGTTRVGKTRYCEVLTNQDIRRGDCTIVIDPKGDAELLRSMYVAAKLAGREKDFYVIHLGYPEHSARYNPISEYTRVTEVPSRIARQLPGEGQSASFREFVWGYVNGITKAMAWLGVRADYRTLERYANNLEPLVAQFCDELISRAKASKTLQIPADFKNALRAYANAKDPADEKRWLMRVPQTMGDRDRYTVALMYFCQGLIPNLGNDVDLTRDTPGEGLIKLFGYDPKYYDKLVSSLFPFLAKLTTGRVAEIISPDYEAHDDKRPTLEWMSFIRQNGIAYIGLDALSDPDVAAVVGSTMFSDLVSTLGRIYKDGYEIEGLDEPGTVRRNIRLHADEFSDLIREDFIPLLNKGGGAGASAKGGFSVVAYTQTLSDIKSRLGDAAKAGQTLGNLNTVLMLRVKEPETADLLVKQVGKVTVVESYIETGASDNPDSASGPVFRSSSSQRIVPKDVSMIDIDDIIQLPKGQAFLISNGGQLTKIRLPILVPGKVTVPASLQSMVDDMRQRYESADVDNWAKWTPIWQKLSIPVQDVTIDPELKNPVVVDAHGAAGLQDHDVPPPVVRDQDLQELIDQESLSQ